MHTPTSPVSLAWAQAAKAGELLVAQLDELDLVADLVEGEVQPVAPVAGVAVDAAHAPLAQALEHEHGDVGSTHGRALTRSDGGGSGDQGP
jgi:hypothetical protein